MKKRHRIVLLLAVGGMLTIVTIAVIHLFRSAREPSYAGRSLSQWVEQYGGLQKTNQQYCTAIRQIGTNALPYLVKWIEDKPSGWKEFVHDRYYKLFFKVSSARSPFEKEFALSFNAVSAFEILGSDAEGAIGDLERIIHDPRSHNRQEQAIAALCGIGKNGLPPLLAALTNQQVVCRDVIPTYLARLGTNASVAVPVLVHCLKDKDEEVARTAATALGELKLDVEFVVPALVDRLADTNLLRQTGAMLALENLAGENGITKMALSQAMQHPDPVIQLLPATPLSASTPTSFKKPPLPDHTIVAKQLTRIP